ncbi:MAG TPA: outer membrane protein assembly factor BamE [Limnobacter sp.]|nr:outer membrane protein assembly factor BamE [Limnobacter sp.]
MRILRLNWFSCAAVSLALTGCSYLPQNYVPSFVKPYRFDIQQGNFITQQDVSKLQVGMSKEQVRFILGTPLLNDAFHGNRWDYVYRLSKADGQVTQARYTVIFENERLARHGGENLPANATDLQGVEGNPKMPSGPLSSEKPAADIQKSESPASSNERSPELK